MHTDTFQPLSRDEMARLRAALAGNGNGDGGVLMDSSTTFAGVCTEAEAKAAARTVSAINSLAVHY